MSELRVGHAEREGASHRLADHYAEGRLDEEEYSERLDAIWSARTRGDLAVVFHDLPAPVRAPRPAGPARPSYRPRPGERSWLVPVLVVAGVLALLGLALDVFPWWLLLVAAIIVAKKAKRSSGFRPSAGR